MVMDDNNDEEYDSVPIFINEEQLEHLSDTEIELIILQLINELSVDVEYRNLAKEAELAFNNNEPDNYMELLEKMYVYGEKKLSEYLASDKRIYDIGEDPWGTNYH